MDSITAVQALGALAHETRLAIFRMLVERGPDVARPGEMSRFVLGVLREAAEPMRTPDLAILRTTPALLGLFSLVAVWADELARAPIGAVRSRTARWYDKREPTFSDAIAAVRRALWSPPGFIHVPPEHEDRRNLRRPAATAHGHPLLRSLKRGKSS